MGKENLNDYKDAYDQGFKYHDENMSYLTRYAGHIKTEIDSGNIKSILSLGIGHSVVGDAILECLKSKKISDYHIVEGSGDIIERFAHKNGDLDGLKLFESYFEHFAPDAKYDAIEMGFVLEHVDDPQLVINRFTNYLVDGGVMFIGVPNARSLHRLIGHKANLLGDVYSLSDYDHKLGHKRYYDLNTIKNQVTNAGLKIVEEKGLMLKPITSDQIKQLNWSDSVKKAIMEVGDDFPDIASCIYLKAIKP